MDRDSRTILFSFVGVVGLAVAVLAASLVVPFDVNRSATVQQYTGDVELRSPDDPPDRFDPARDETPLLKPGQTLKVMPDGMAVIRFGLNNGRATMTGPAELTLVAAYRRATTLGHVFDSGQFEREYVLTLAQSSGTVEYDFANADPPFDGASISIQLPESDYTPVTPCWRVTISSEGIARIEPLDCPAATG